MASNFAAANDIAANVEKVSKADDIPTANGIEKQDIGDPNLIQQNTDKYKTERDKRFRADGLAQYLDPSKSSKFQHFTDDPWVNPEKPDLGVPLQNDSHHKILIVGAGFGGILYAYHLIQAGFTTDDLQIVDSAGGFGGTWYWNRYPGLMCDVEGSVYLPLLEEMGYIPTTRYPFGEDIRMYIESIAKKYGLDKIASFGLQVKELHWNEKENVWDASLIRKLPKAQENETLHVHANFTCLANGVLNYPKLPEIPGIETFQGSTFHTSRWNYDATGGTPEKPDLHKLSGKNVAIIGTGATGVQVVPQVAKWAKNLYVVQRTPSAVDWRGNHPISADDFRSQIATKPGWQRERQLNFAAFVNKHEPPPTTNLVNDAWTTIPSYSALLGTPNSLYDGTHEGLKAHLEHMHALDMPRQNRIRARVSEHVHDPITAANLKPWYATWCKRPCFHDEYLSSFNRPNVHLLSTDGASIAGITPTGILLPTSSASSSTSPTNTNTDPTPSTQHIPIDTLIFSTGFNAAGYADPAHRAQMLITGRRALSMTTAWTSCPDTLHGIISASFPNMFFPGPFQAAGGVSFTFVIEELAKHAAYVIKETCRRADGGGGGEGVGEGVGQGVGEGDVKPVVEPTPEGVEEWGMRIAKGAGLFAALVGCTPSYITREGEIERPVKEEDMLQRAKGGAWSDGLESFLAHLEEWRAEGGMNGLSVSSG